MGPILLTLLYAWVAALCTGSTVLALMMLGSWIAADGSDRPSVRYLKAFCALGVASQAALWGWFALHFVNAF